MDSIKSFWNYLKANVQNIPLLGPLLLQLTNEAVWIMLFGQGIAFWLYTAEDVALLASIVSLTTAVLAGMRQWRDLRVAIETNRKVIENVLSTGLHAAKVNIPYKGKTITLDIPDEWEPEIAKQFLDSLLSVIPQDEAA
jgi:hypothetical protein